MDIHEAFELYLKGAPVADPYGTAPDLEYVMYPEEDDFVWRMVDLPVDAVGCDLSMSPNPGCQEAEEARRFEGIQAWMDERGIVKALAECPPIARMTDEFGIEVIDGRHRLALAHRAGLTHVRLMLGAAPDWGPSKARTT